jgi:uncharacterized membrane protein YbhN (UPF0104 family)
MFVALIWMGVAFTYSGAWVMTSGETIVGGIFTVIGVAILTASFAAARWLLGQWQVPMLILVTKVALVLLDALRIYLCLWALGTAGAFAQASALAISGVLGSAVSIVPAGLGVREGVAAAMAPIVGLAASSAFLAASLNRLLGLATTAPVAMVLAVRASNMRTDQVSRSTAD